MAMPGFSELIVILIIILIIFGAGKLPQIGDALGKGIKNFRRSASGKDEIDITPESSSKVDKIPPQAEEKDKG